MASRPYKLKSEVQLNALKLAYQESPYLIPKTLTDVMATGLSKKVATAWFIRERALRRKKQNDSRIDYSVMFPPQEQGPDVNQLQPANQKRPHVLKAAAHSGYTDRESSNIGTNVHSTIRVYSGVNQLQPANLKRPFIVRSATPLYYGNQQPLDKGTNL